MARPTITIYSNTEEGKYLHAELINVLREYDTNILNSYHIENSENVDFNYIISSIVASLPAGGLILSFLIGNQNLEFLAKVRETNLLAPNYIVFSLLCDPNYAFDEQYRDIMTGHYFYSTYYNSYTTEFYEKIHKVYPFEVTDYELTAYTYSSIILYKEAYLNAQSTSSTDLLYYLYETVVITPLGDVKVFPNNHLSNIKGIVRVASRDKAEIFEEFYRSDFKYKPYPYLSSISSDIMYSCNWYPKLGEVGEKIQRNVLLIGVLLSTGKDAQQDFYKLQGVMASTFLWNDRGGVGGYYLQYKIIKSDTFDKELDSSVTIPSNISVVIGCISKSCRKKISSMIYPKLLMTVNRYGGNECTENIVNYGSIPQQYLEPFINRMVTFYYEYRAFVIYSNSEYELEAFNYYYGYANEFLDTEYKVMLDDINTPLFITKNLLRSTKKLVVLLFTNFADTYQILEAFHDNRITSMESIQVFIVSLENVYLLDLDREHLHNVLTVFTVPFPSKDDEIYKWSQTSFGITEIPELFSNAFHATHYWITGYFYNQSENSETLRKSFYAYPLDAFYGKIVVYPNNHASQSFLISSYFSPGKYLISDIECKYPIFPFVYSWYEERGYICDFAIRNDPHYKDIGIQIPIVAPFIGADKAYSQGILEIFEMFISEINTKGGIMGHNVNYQVFDVKSDPERAPLIVQIIIDLKLDLPFLVLSLSKEVFNSMYEVFSQMNFLILSIGETKTDFCEKNVIEAGLSISIYDRAMDILLLSLYPSYLVVAKDGDTAPSYVVKYLQRKSTSVIQFLYKESDEFSFQASMYEIINTFKTGCIIFLGSLNDHVALDKAMFNLNMTLPAYTLVSFTTGEDAIFLGVNLEFISGGAYFISRETKENVEFLANIKMFLEDTVPIKDSMVIAYESVQMFAIAANKVNIMDIEKIKEYWYTLEFTGPEGKIALSTNNYMRRSIMLTKYIKETKTNIFIYESEALNTPEAWLSVGTGSYFLCNFLDPAIGKKKRQQTITILVAAAINSGYNVEMCMLNILEQAVDDVNKKGGLLGRIIQVDVRDSRRDPEEFISILESGSRTENTAIFGGFDAAMFSSSNRITNSLLFFPGQNPGDSCYNGVISTMYNVQQVFVNIKYHISLDNRPLYLVYYDADFSILIKRYFIDLITSLGLILSGESNLSLVDVETAISDIKVTLSNGGIIMNTLTNIDLVQKFFNSLCKNELLAPQYVVYSPYFFEFYVLGINPGCMNGHYTVSSFFSSLGNPKLNRGVITDRLKEFISKSRDRIGNNALESIMEAIDVGFILWSNAVSKLKSFDSKMIVQYLYGKPFLVPSGKIMLNSNNYVSRRMYTGRFNEKNEIEIVYDPEALVVPVSFSSITSETEQLNVCDWSGSTSESVYQPKYKRIIFLHESDEEYKTIEIVKMNIQNLISEEINAKGGILTFKLVNSHYFYSIKSGEMTQLVRSIVFQSDVVLVVGCSSLTCSQVISEATEAYKTIFYSLSRHIGTECSQYTFYASPTYYELLISSIGYFKTTIYKNVYYITDTTNYNSRTIELIREKMKNNEMELSGVSELNFEATSDELLKMFNDCFKNISDIIERYTLLIAIAIPGSNQNTLLEFLRSKFTTFLKSQFLLLDNDYVIHSDEVKSMLKQNYAVQIQGTGEMFLYSRQFKKLITNNYGMSFPYLEGGILSYNSIYLWKKSLEIARSFSKEEWPNSDYVRLSTINIEIPSTTGVVSIKSNNVLISNFYLCEIGIDSSFLIYPDIKSPIAISTDSTMELSPDCSFGRTYKNYIYANMNILITIPFVAINFILMLSCSYLIMRYDNSKVILNSNPLFLFSVIAAGFYLAGISYIFLIVPDSKDIVCALRVWLLCIGITLFIGAFITKVWKMYLLLNNKHLSRVWINVINRLNSTQKIM